MVSKDLCEGGELYNYLVFGAGIKKFEEPIARYFFKQVFVWKFGIWRANDSSCVKGLLICILMAFSTAI